MTDYESSLEGILALGIGILLVVLLVMIAWAVFYIIGMWKLFTKAGRPGWAAIVPFYNDYVLCEVAGLNWYWFLIGLIPTIVGLFVDSSMISGLMNLVSIFVNVNIYFNLSKKFGKDTGWVVLMVFFGFVMLPIYGYNKAVYNAAAPVTPNGLIDGLGNKAPVQNGPVAQGYQQPVQPQPVQGVQPVQPQPVQPQPVQGVQPVQQPTQDSQVNPNNQQ